MLRCDRRHRRLRQRRGRHHDGGPDLGKGAPSPQTFSTDLNALCKQGNAAVAQVSTDPAKSLAVVDQFLPKFEALTASGSQQAIYNKFLANIKAEIAALKAGNTTAAKAAAAKNKAYATALNAPACA